MMGIGLIWMLLFWGGLILLAVWLIAVLFPINSQSPTPNTLDPQTGARDSLDHRYV